MKPVTPTVEVPAELADRWPPRAAEGTHPSRAWQVVIPGWHPPSVNELLRAHWRQQIRLKREAYDVVMVFCRQVNMPRAAGKRGYAFAYQLGPRKRACDPNNYLKVLLDGLVSCAALKDDNRQWSVELAAPVFWRGSCNGTIIYLADMTVPEKRCRLCGCTDSDCSRCMLRTGWPCYWVAADLCSACVNEGRGARDGRTRGEGRGARGEKETPHPLTPSPTGGRIRGEGE